MTVREKTEVEEVKGVGHFSPTVYAWLCLLMCVSKLFAVLMVRREDTGRDRDDVCCGALRTDVIRFKFI